MGAKHHKPALIAAVRRCAEAGMSAMQAADELSTPERPLAKGSIIGLANRNGIKFSGTQFGGRNYLCTLTSHVRTSKPRKPRAVREPKPPRPTPSALALHVVTPRRDWKPKLPGPRCSWVGCEHDARLGDMFCYSHSRMPLFGKVTPCV